MPFTPYKASLDPETMQAALEAFDLAWAEVMASPDSQDAPACRDLLAKRIIDAAPRTSTATLLTAHRAATTYQVQT